MGGLHDHPSPKEFTYRLRKHILVKNNDLIANHCNVELDEDPPSMISASVLHPLIGDAHGEVLEESSTQDKK